MTDPFQTARSGFVKLDDLLGRLLLVVPQSIEERESTLPGSQGRKYDSITADVIVCDGDVTDVIEEVPTTLESVFFSGAVVVNQLRGAVKGSKMVLGRLGKQKSQTKGFGDAWVLQEPTEDDKKIARPVATAYLADNDPFAGA